MTMTHAVAGRSVQITGASGINPVSRIAWENHIPPDWPTRALLWMCTPDADEFVGTEIGLRDTAIRERAGLA